MDPTLVPGTHFESQFQICVYEHAILRIYISFFPTYCSHHTAQGSRKFKKKWKESPVRQQATEL